MPLPLVPLILGGAAVAAAGYGIKKGFDAKESNENANRYAIRANERFESSSERLARSEERSKGEFQNLGEFQEEVIRTTLANYRKFLQDEFQVNESDHSGSNNADIKGVPLSRLANEILSLENLVVGLGAGTVAGAMTGFGAYGAVTLWGTASTGAAIGSLSGGAVMTSTLAWFGGGSLAAGGLGMAGGICVLGGLVVSPILAITGYCVAEKEAENEEKARFTYQTVDRLCDFFDAESVVWCELGNEAREKCSMLAKQRLKMENLMSEIQGIKDVDKSWKDKCEDRLNEMRLIAEDIKERIKTAVMHDNHWITKGLMKLQNRRKEFQERVQNGETSASFRGEMSRTLTAIKTEDLKELFDFELKE